MIIECEAGLRDHPQVREIEQELMTSAGRRFADRLPVFERVLHSTLPLDALKLALQRIAAEPDHQLSRFVLDGVIKGWTFLVTSEFALSIGVRGAPQVLAQAQAQAQAQTAPGAGPKLQPYPFDLFLGHLAGAPYGLQCYTVLSSESPLPALQWQSARQMAQGSSLFLRAGVDVVSSKLEGALVFLEITGPSGVRILPQFDPETLAFSGWVSGDATASRLELLTRTLAEFNHRPAAARLAALARHQDHYVRWNSLRHLLRIDAASGLRELQRAGSDPHPEIRELAGSLLERMGLRHLAPPEEV